MSDANEPQRLSPLQALAAGLQAVRAAYESEGGRYIHGEIKQGSADAYNVLIHGSAANVYSSHQLSQEGTSGPQSETNQAESTANQTSEPGQQLENTKQETHARHAQVQAKAVVDKSELHNLKFEVADVQQSESIAPEPTPSVPQKGGEQARPDAELER
jgi:hypothetical protein